MLNTGAFFGEMSLLSNERRSATGEQLLLPYLISLCVNCIHPLLVIAVDDSVCLVLSRADFDKLLGPLDDIIKAESKRRNEALLNAAKKKSDAGLLINRLRTISGSFFGSTGEMIQSL